MVCEGVRRNNAAHDYSIHLVQDMTGAALSVTNIYYILSKCTYDRVAG